MFIGSIDSCWVFRMEFCVWVLRIRKSHTVRFGHLVWKQAKVRLKGIGALSWQKIHNFCVENSGRLEWFVSGISNILFRLFYPLKLLNILLRSMVEENDEWCFCIYWYRCDFFELEKNFQRLECDLLELNILNVESIVKLASITFTNSIWLNFVFIQRLYVILSESDGNTPHTSVWNFQSLSNANINGIFKDAVQG